MLLHGFQECSLGLGRRSIDFVCENDVSEDRPLRELHGTTAVGFCEDLGAGDVGWHEIGGKLNATKLKMEDLRYAADEQRFRQTWRTGN